MQNVQERQDAAALLTADQVESMLGVDKSTVYRMAADGRLPAIKVGRQWRFPSGPLRELLEGAGLAFTAPLATANRRSQRDLAQPVVDLAANLLGVMMVATDMDGDPITAVANPCPWFAARMDDPSVLETCVTDWRALAADDDLEPLFRPGPHGFECARALVRDGNRLVGMVLAGGIAPHGAEPAADDGLYHLDDEARQEVLRALPRVAATIARVAPRFASTSRSES